MPQDPSRAVGRYVMGDTGHSANRADSAEFEGWALDLRA
jgi:hypothetical protein